MGTEDELNEEGAEKFKFPEEEGGGEGRDNLGGYTTEEFDEMRSDPATADHARGIIEQREHLEEVEDKERDRAWRKKYPQFAQVEQTKKGPQFPSTFSTLRDAVKHSLSPGHSDIRETMWYDVEEMLQSKTAPEDLIDAALEHPSHFVPKAAAENYRLSPEQLAKILSRDDIDLIRQDCLAAQTKQGMTPEEIRQAQELAETEHDETKPINFQGTIKNLELLKASSNKQIYREQIAIIRAMLQGSRERSAESGYEGWTDGNLREVLSTLGEQE